MINGIVRDLAHDCHVADWKGNVGGRGRQVLENWRKILSMLDHFMTFKYSVRIGYEYFYAAEWKNDRPSNVLSSLISFLNARRLVFYFFSRMNDMKTISSMFSSISSGARLA